MATPPTPRLRKGLPIVAYLVFGVSALMILSIGGVLLVTLSIASRNTYELLEDKSRLLITGVARQLELYLAPAASQVEALANADRARPARSRRSRAAVRRAAGGARREPAGPLGGLPRRLGLADGGDRRRPRADGRRSPTGATIAAGLEAVGDALGRDRREPYWGPPVWLKDPGVTVVNLRRPVIEGGEVIGVLASTITVRTLSEFVTGLETELGQNAFILYERERVLAHSALAFDFPDLGVERPLPRVEEIGDPVLFEIWREGWQQRRLERHAGPLDRLGEASTSTSIRRSSRRWTRAGWSAAISPTEAIDAPVERSSLAPGSACWRWSSRWWRPAARPPGQPPGRGSSRRGGRDRSLDLDDWRRSDARACARSIRPRSRSTRWSAALRVFAVYVPRSSCTA